MVGGGEKKAKSIGNLHTELLYRVELDFSRIKTYMEEMYEYA